jgi:predicted SAM-dependent methyltransferase
MNWGCGRVTPEGWINSDCTYSPGVDIACDILAGLPLEDDSLDYVASMHALPEIAYPDLEDALWELRRVIRPGGVLRLGLPDMDRAIHAYLRNDREYFLIPDHTCESIGGKMVVQLMWYGRSRTMFTSDFAEELLRHSGFREVHRCEFQQTRSPYPEIIELDNRPQESLFIEGVK